MPFWHLHYWAQIAPAYVWHCRRWSSILPRKSIIENISRHLGTSTETAINWRKYFDGLSYPCKQRPRNGWNETDDPRGHNNVDGSPSPRPKVGTKWMAYRNISENWKNSTFKFVFIITIYPFIRKNASQLKPSRVKQASALCALSLQS